MKTTSPFLIGMILCVSSLSGVCLGQTRPTGDATAPELMVLEMKSVPDGHFLLDLQWEGQSRLVNIESRRTRRSA